MHPISLEHELQNFQNQKCPTLEQTISNNRQVLSKRKKFFTTDLKQSFQLIEIVLIVIIYLRDLSFFRLFLRSAMHFSILNINPDYVSRYYSFSTHHVKTMIKMSFRGVLAINCYCFLTHLIFGVYSKSPGSSGRSGEETVGFLYGGLTVQFMGERVPCGRLELMGLDLIVFGAQLILLYLHGVLGNEEVFEEEEGEGEQEGEQQEIIAEGQVASGLSSRDVTESRTDGNRLQVQHDGGDDIPLRELLSGRHLENDDEVVDKARIEGDGYNGNVELLTIDLLDGIKKMMKIKVNIQNAGETSGLSTSSSTLPGAFPRVSSLV
ncbi:hypothetical protein KGF57_004098 [Candida theae]|uniref:DUF1746 domain-containing protein n=1 Tax=Candida theae TaxID=1198502 RepID=A0AAD5FXF0_9ASCO|nr:uncharacterized protein KGF57_004098 [Candida theae]KAI5952982.1 hypothetical protein KGF57_004098 [Candida theae]